MWIELTDVGNEKRMYYFGNGGITQFYSGINKTILISPNRTWEIYVLESYDYIKDILLNNQGN